VFYNSLNLSFILQISLNLITRSFFNHLTA